MDPLKIAVIGTGSIAQIVHLPVLKNIEGVTLNAICDIDDTKITPLLEKYGIPNGYRQADRLFKTEKLDAVHICTANHYHYPMAYMALMNDVNVFMEKPIALNAADAQKLDILAKERNLQVLVGMQNRFRDDVMILKEFIEKDELGEIFYIKSGWLKQYKRKPFTKWKTNPKKAGGGVVLDLGSQLIDLALFLLGMPKIKSVRLYDYSLNPDLNVEDAALAVIETVKGASMTIEVSWKMHLEKDMIYTHIFGKNGAAYLNPLRINKELHGNLVNVTPYTTENSAARFKKAYESEIQHFIRVVRGEEENRSSSADAVRIMRIIEALYESARLKQQVDLNE